MPIATTPDTVADGLFIQAVDRDDELASVKAYGMAVIAAAAAASAAGISRDLCDESECAYAPRILGTFDSAKSIAAAAPHVARVAIVCSAKQAGDAGFWETVALNHSLLVKMFIPCDEAKRWREPSPGATGRAATFESSALQRGCVMPSPVRTVTPDDGRRACPWFGNLRFFSHAVRTGGHPRNQPGEGIENHPGAPCIENGLRLPPGSYKVARFPIIVHSARHHGTGPPSRRVGRC